MKHLTLATLVGITILASCTTAKHPALPMVRVRAGKDLRCPDKQIQITPMMGSRYQASGCGRTAIYFSACEQLQCSVGLEGEDPVPWRDRPDPGSPDSMR